MTNHRSSERLERRRNVARAAARVVTTVIWALTAQALLAPAAYAVPPAVPAGETIRIADKVHVIPDQGVALVPNVGIVAGDDGILVIDTGMGPENAETVLSETRKISDLPIRFLVSTHFHPEHNFGAQAFPAETLLIYSIAQHRDLQRKGERYRQWFIEMFGEDVRGFLEPVKLVPPDVTFERRAGFDLGHLPVEAYHFGRAAHTGGDTVVFLPEQKIAFVGGLVPNGFFPIFPDEDSSVAGWITSLDELKALGAETIVPGHGPIGQAALIDTVRDYLVSIQARASELHSHGAPLQSAQDTLFDEFTRRYPDWGESHWIRNAVERVYAEASRPE
jgi:glyoxylase-like metal-dependent hydrolase (beta-lactamase superfamily II)